MFNYILRSEKRVLCSSAINQKQRQQRPFKNCQTVCLLFEKIKSGGSSCSQTHFLSSADSITLARDKNGFKVCQWCYRKWCPINCLLTSIQHLHASCHDQTPDFFRICSVVITRLTRACSVLFMISILSNSNLSSYFWGYSSSLWRESILTILSSLSKMGERTYN